MGLHLAYYMATVGYPLLETYKAIEQTTCDAQWVKVLSYWAIFTLLKVVDSALSFMSGYVHSSTLRFLVYQMLQLVFLLWLMLPQYAGALLLHSLYLDKAYIYLDQHVLSKAPIRYSLIFLL